MSSQLPVRRSTGLFAALRGGDPISEAANHIQQGAFLARTRRSTERDLALLEVGDVEAVTARALAGAGNIASYAAVAVENNPLAESGVSAVLMTGNIGLQRALIGYIDRSQS